MRGDRQVSEQSGVFPNRRMAYTKHCPSSGFAYGHTTFEELVLLPSPCKNVKLLGDPISHETTKTESGYNDQNDTMTNV